MDRWCVVHMRRISTGLDLGFVWKYNMHVKPIREVKRPVTATKERYIIDREGTRIGVLLDMEEYQDLLEALEELESIRSYDAAKASGDEAIPFEQALDEIEKDRA